MRLRRAQRCGREVTRLPITRDEERATHPPGTRRCECCAYAVALKDGERELRVCTDRPGEAGALSIVQAGDVCRRFRKRREKPFRLEPPEPPSDDVRYIPLTRGLFAIVDAADYERVSRYKWCATGSGSRAYACRSHYGRHLSMHRFIMNPPDGMVVDHIDGNRLNNRRSNLRICTIQQNIWNSRPKGKSSRYKGVCRDRDKKKWVVYVRCNGHNWYMGRFEAEIDAARAYDRKAFELFGEYAWLNFPEEYGTPAARPRLCKGTTVQRCQERRVVRAGLRCGRYSVADLRPPRAARGRATAPAPDVSMCPARISIKDSDGFAQEPPPRAGVLHAPSDRTLTWAECGGKVRKR